MSAAGVVAALALEARTLKWRIRRPDGLLAVGDGTLVAVSGIGTAAAALAAERLVDAGACALVSWGLAGGLDPELRAGTLCLPSVVVARGGETFATDLHWREILRATIAARCSVVGGKLLTSREAIGATLTKAHLFRETGAVAVDMESVGVAAVAARHGLPFVAVRVIADAAGDALPQAVVAAASGDGGVRILSLLFGIARSPRQLKPLLRLARGFFRATRTLAAVAATGALAPLKVAAPSPTHAA